MTNHAIVHCFSLRLIQILYIFLHQLHKTYESCDKKAEISERYKKNNAQMLNTSA